MADIIEQNGNTRAEYGQGLLKRLSQDLTLSYGKGFGLSNLKYIRKFYVTFQKGGTPSHQLSWGHYYEILKIDDELECDFYIRQCELERWNVRELKRQINSMLFHRIADMLLDEADRQKKLNNAEKLSEYGRNTKRT